MCGNDREFFFDLGRLAAAAPGERMVFETSNRHLAGGIRRIYDGFGPQRMLWGSDISGLPCTYGECLRQFSESLEFLTADDKEWILGKSLAKFYDWPES